MSISAVMIAYNEESNIERCLESLTFADEIIVLDSFSTDRTIEIARRFTDKVSQREFVGFSDQRNAAKELASGEWLFVIDADEVVTPGLAAEIQEAVKSDEFDAYRMPRLTYFFGRPIRHCGWYPDYSPRLARKSKTDFGDRLVHETISIDGPVGTLKNGLVHYSYKNMDDAVRKMLDYSHRGARQRFIEGRRARVTDLLFRPGVAFLRHYVWQQGFRDGLRGFMISMFTLSGTFIRYAALWEMWLRKEQDRNE